ncbi:MAG: hypothetical protein COX81_02440 [Candidatus Magasanikbacteria bacterium CG_4_10_14_0_2_um_filter_37_12]|uniref:Uncharacterized protein n=1 Tax=Candidatus Magasanikbacteria bacterium CG_4_10_14_0_2_um_filter_37_12 TaxID=1974637 RepID=A0A2M7V7X6_9BACT|nr:MAG: hypothetical protein COX81_02440 [Candidatus Magasanikbacteria bacterium CG_4_10_14_0_2_um_filter_37_12]
MSGTFISVVSALPSPKILISLASPSSVSGSPKKFGSSAISKSKYNPLVAEFAVFRVTVSFFSYIVKQVTLIIFYG